METLFRLVFRLPKAQFKSYYVVWKQIYLNYAMSDVNGLNRTM